MPTSDRLTMSLLAGLAKTSTCSQVTYQVGCDVDPPKATEDSVNVSERFCAQSIQMLQMGLVSTAFKWYGHDRIFSESLN